MVAVPSLLYEPQKGMDWFVVPVLVGLALGIAAPLREAKTHQNALDELRTDVDNASADATVLYGTIMVPTMERLHKFVAAKGSVEKAETYTDLVAKLLGETAGFLGSEDVHVKVNCYRLVEEDGKPYLRVVSKTRDVSREILDESTPEGAAILRRTLEGSHEHCPDTSNPHHYGLDARRERDYLCFASVTIKSAGVVYGMVSANTNVANGIPAHGLDYLKVVGAILATAEAHFGKAKGRVEGDTRGLTVSGLV